MPSKDDTENENTTITPNTQTETQEAVQRSNVSSRRSSVASSVNSNSTLDQDVKVSTEKLSFNDFANDFWNPWGHKFLLKHVSVFLSFL